MSIALTPEQKPYLDELNGYLTLFKQAMETPLSNDINVYMDHLSECMSLIALQGRMIELSTAIYGTAKGEIFKNLDTSLKAHESRLWFEGEIAKWEALYQKTDRSIKSLDKYNDNLRTLISAEKSLRETFNP